MDLDLVCENKVEDSHQPQYFSDYNGSIYPFCSPACKRKFDDHPDYFIQRKAKKDLGLDE